MPNQLKLILDDLFRIWHGRYQPLQLYLWAGDEASFFLIYTGDSVVHMPRPVFWMFNVSWTAPYEITLVCLSIRLFICPSVSLSLCYQIFSTGNN